MSRADPTAARANPAGRPPAPRLGGVFRQAGVDFYYNSWRLVPANLLWGAGVVCLLVGAGATPVALLLVPLLALPTVAIYRLAAKIARGQPAAFSDGVEAMRTHGLAALAAATALAVLVAVFGTNVVVGIASQSPLGWTIATLAAWGLLVTIVASVAFWPILADPLRDGRPQRDAARLALLLVLAFPLRLAALALVVGLIVVLSTIAFAAVVTISIAFVALASARYVLPASDRFAPREPRDRSASDATGARRAEGDAGA